LGESVGDLVVLDAQEVIIESRERSMLRSSLAARRRSASVCSSVSLRVIAMRTMMPI
jgi:hypothetical protein